MTRIGIVTASTRRWAAVVESLDAVVLVMPEYNRGYSAALKNAIDCLYAQWYAGLFAARSASGTTAAGR